MSYKENPKTEGSGILCCLAQIGRCPNMCHDCLFRSIEPSLESPDQDRPNIPTVEQAQSRVIRINEGLDSKADREAIMSIASRYPMRFYNTVVPKGLETLDSPVVLTVNPGESTDSDFFQIRPIPNNLMFARVRTNTWNLHLVDKAVSFYTSQGVPAVLAFVTYRSAGAFSGGHGTNYVYLKHAQDMYWVVRTSVWREVMKRYQDNILVSSCGRIEGQRGDTRCRYCGNCLREYFATMARM